MPHVMAVVGAASAVAKSGSRVDPYTGFRFRVQIVGMRSWRGGFSSIEGLEEENEVVEYREGTDRITKKLPGIYKATELMLNRGKSRSNDLQIWRGQVDLVQKRGQFPSAAFRRTIKPQLMNDFNQRLKGWTAYQCWPSKLSHATLDANSSEVWIETATIQHEGLLPDPMDLRPI